MHFISHPWYYIRGIANNITGATIVSGILLFTNACYITDCFAIEAPQDTHLISLDKDIPWQQACAKVELNRLNAPSSTTDTKLPIQINAASAEALPQQDYLRLQGKVQITQANQQLFADQAVIDRRQQQIQADGNVLLRQDALRLYATQIDYNLQHQSGQANNIHYRLPTVPARGTAAEARVLSSTQSHYDQISYTTCQPNDSSWVLSAEQLELDQAEGWGSMRHATLTFMGVPIGYTPWLSFPIDDRRRSGFLPPSIGYNDDDGVRIQIPYYVNLASNYDLTLQPMLMSRRGLLLGTEWRLLTANTQSTLQADYIAQDRQYAQPQNHRGRISLRSASQWTDHLSSNIMIDYVSDDDYLTDFGRTLAYSSTTLLPQSARLDYRTQDWAMTALIKGYQVLNNGSQPYRILPQIHVRRQNANIPNTTAYLFDAEITQFDKPGDTALDAIRFDMQTGISWPLQASYFHLTPKLSTRYTKYHLRHHTTGMHTAPDRLTGHLSVDGGLYFERNTTYADQPSIHTLEPRVFYQYITAADQDDIPIFDTASYSFSPNHLYRDNRFTGADRVGDAHQMTLALTTRLHNRINYQEYLRASIGQIYYFQDRTVTMPGQPIETAKTSAIVGDIRAKIGQNWQANGNITWEPQTNTFEQLTVQTAYRADDAHRVALTYRLRDTVTEHIGLATHWALTDNIHLVARWQYDLTEQVTREALTGLEYQACCWRVRLVAHEQLDNQQQPDMTYGVQLELNGLGKLGNDIDDILNNRLLP